MYKTEQELVDALSFRMRDGGHLRWSSNEKKIAIDLGISGLSNHVGFYARYAAPSTVLEVPFYFTDQVLVEAGGVILNTIIYENEPIPTNSILLGWVYNYPFAEQAGVSLAADLTSDDTSLVVDKIISPVGHLKINNEIIRYNGVVEDSGNYLVTDIERNVDGLGSLATSSIGTTITPLIYYDDARIHDQIMNMAAAYLHSLYPTSGSPTEVQHHQWMMRWHTNEVNSFWRTYVPRKNYRRKAMRK